MSGEYLDRTRLGCSAGPYETNVSESKGMTVTIRVKLGLVTAVAVAGTLCGLGAAEAAPAPHVLAASADVGVPDRGVHPGGTVIAPDGTRINAIGNEPYRVQVTGKSAPASARTATAQGYSTGNIVQTKVNANVRAWIPNGTVLGTTRTGEAGGLACRIPGPGGYTWGWVEFVQGWAGSYYYLRGWMRTDLVRYLTAGTPPWC